MAQSGVPARRIGLCADSGPPGCNLSAAAGEPYRAGGVDITWGAGARGKTTKSYGLMELDRREWGEGGDSPCRGCGARTAGSTEKVTPPGPSAGLLGRWQVPVGRLEVDRGRGGERSRG